MGAYEALVSLLENGSNVVIDGRAIDEELDTDELIEAIHAAVKAGSHVTFRNALRMSVFDRERISKMAKSSVTFDFTGSQ